MYQLTMPDKRFAEKIAKEINKDYPEAAFVKDGCCFLTTKYWRQVRNSVEANCKIKRAHRYGQYLNN